MVRFPKKLNKLQQAYFKGYLDCFYESQKEDHKKAKKLLDYLMAEGKEFVNDEFHITEIKSFDEWLKILRKQDFFPTELWERIKDLK